MNRIACLLSTTFPRKEAILCCSSSKTGHDNMYFGSKVVLEIWKIWCGRNRRIFHNSELTVVTVARVAINEFSVGRTLTHGTSFDMVA